MGASTTFDLLNTPLEEALEKMGFTFTSASDIASRIGANCHMYAATYWAKAAITAAFSNNYDLHLINNREWDGKLHTVVMPNGKSMNVVGQTTGFKGDGELILETITSNFPPPKQGFRRFYHGTIAKSAEAIVEQGIDFDKGERPTDFCPIRRAFYCCEDPVYPVIWSYMKFGDSVFLGLAVFDITEKEYNERLSLDLHDKNLGKWKEVVTSSRQGKIEYFEKLRDNAQVICGPICGNAALVESGRKEPLPLEINEVIISQICLCDDDEIAGLFSENIVGIVYFDIKKIKNE